MTSPTISDTDQIGLTFRTIASDEWFRQLYAELGLRPRKGIFSFAVVIWLMIYQRLHAKGTLAAAVQMLVHWADGAPTSFPNACKRIRSRRISTNTGGYCQARQNLPTLVASRVNQHLFEQLRLRMPPPSGSRPAFVIDGTTLRLAHRAELVESFPPGHNQHGDNHWPILEMVVFHDVYTGLAATPRWGPMYGPHAVSEQQLAIEALEQLPADAIVLADANFGIFAFAHAVQQSGRPVLARLTQVRAKRLLGETVPPAGTRRKVTWTPSQHERKARPELAADASVEGWVVVCRNPSRPSEILYFFTTLDWTPDQVLELYKLRWNIETDLRSLKMTVRLHEIQAQSKSMMEKELLLAVVAYNVVRAAIYVAARRAGLLPRQFSFSVSQDAVLAALPYLNRADSPQEYDRQLELLLTFVSKAKLPKRSRRRSYPRTVWGRGGRFPQRKSGPRASASQEVAQ